MPEELLDQQQSKPYKDAHNLHLLLSPTQLCRVTAASTAILFRQKTLESQERGHCHRAISQSGSINQKLHQQSDARSRHRYEVINLFILKSSDFSFELCKKLVLSVFFLVTQRKEVVSLSQENVAPVTIMSKVQLLDENTGWNGTISSTGWPYEDGYYMYYKAKESEAQKIRNCSFLLCYDIFNRQTPKKLGQKL